MTRKNLETIEAYRCPKCKAILTCKSPFARAHIDTVQDTPLPNGFTYLSQEGGCVNLIYGPGKISTSTKVRMVHGNEQPIMKYSIVLGMFLHGPIEYVNSREVKVGLEHGNLEEVPKKLFKKIKSSSRLLETAEGDGLILHRVFT